MNKQFNVFHARVIKRDIKLIIFDGDLHFRFFITSADSAFSHDHQEIFISFISTWKTRRNYDDFTRHVAYQPPQDFAFNIVIDPTREQT